MKAKRKALPRTVVLLGIIWIFLCVYVYLSCKIIAIGYKMEEVKKRYEEINMLNKNYKAELLKLSSPEYLLTITRNAGIKLTTPAEWCYVDINIDEPKGTKNDTAEAGIH